MGFKKKNVTKHIPMLVPKPSTDHLKPHTYLTAEIANTLFYPFHPSHHLKKTKMAEGLGDPWVREKFTGCIFAFFHPEYLAEHNHRGVS